MRIVGGYLKGRSILAPKTRDTRPVTDFIREAIFDILGDVKGFKVLDCYAGSGALGIEALSRSVEHVDGIEKSAIVVKIIKGNLQKLGLEDQYRLYRQSVSFWAKTHRKLYGSYNLIFVDQPFTDLRIQVLNLVSPYLISTGTLVSRFPKRMAVPKLPGLSMIDERHYGDSIVAFYHPSV